MVLVTGAAKGIGKEIALSLAREGADVAVNYLSSQGAAEETVGEIRKLGGKAVAACADIASLDQVRLMKEEIERQLGPVYGVVNNAGYAPAKKFFKTQPEDWKRVVDVCFYGTLHLAYVFVPTMVEQGEGKMVNLVGDSARMGDPNLIISAAARGGVISFSKSLAQDVGKNGVQVNVVSLGLVDQGYLGFSEETLEKIRKKYPVQRTGVPNDVAAACLFLLSHQSSWITGQVLSVNGGYSMMG